MEDYYDFYLLKKSLAFDFYHQLIAKEEYLLELKLESGETIEIPDIELKKLFIKQNEDGSTSISYDNKTVKYNDVNTEEVINAITTLKKIHAFLDCHNPLPTWEESAIKRLNAAGLLYEGECPSSLRYFIFKEDFCYPTGREILEKLKNDVCFVPNQKVMMICNGLRDNIHLSSGKGRRELFYLYNIIVTEKNAIFLGSIEYYKEPSGNRALLGGSYDGYEGIPNTECVLKVIPISEINNVDIKICEATKSIPAHVMLRFFRDEHRSRSSHSLFSSKYQELPILAGKIALDEWNKIIAFSNKINDGR